MIATHPVSLQQASRLKSYSDGQSVSCPAVLEIIGALDPQRLRRSVQRLVERHDSLRMFFPRKTPHQGAVHSARCTGQYWSEVDLGGRLTRQQLRVRLRNELYRKRPCWDVTFFSAVLYRLDSQHHVLAMDNDHLVVDGVSWQILTQDLILIYERDGRPLPTEDDDMTYAEFCRAQRSAAEGDIGAGWQRYWTELFKERCQYPPPVALPAPARPTRADAARKLSVAIPQEIAASTAAQARALGTSNFSAWSAIVLRAVRRRDPTCHGLVTDAHGRLLPGSERTVGLFSHGIGLYGPATGNLAEDVRAMGNTVLNALEYATPLRRFVRDSTLKDSLAEGFVYFGDSSIWDVDTSMGDARVLTFHLLDPDEATADRGSHLIALYLAHLADGSAVVTAEFESSVYEADVISDVLNHILLGARQLAGRT